jgi:hypothetical protein
MNLSRPRAHRILEKNVRFSQGHVLDALGVADDRRSRL